MTPEEERAARYGYDSAHEEARAHYQPTIATLTAQLAEAQATAARLAVAADEIEGWVSAAEDCYDERDLARLNRLRAALTAADLDADVQALKVGKRVLSGEFFDRIKHGDEAHQQWLRDVIAALTQEAN